MPAAAVIPAPIAYIKVVAVKKPVVGLESVALVVRRKVSTAEPALLPLEDSMCPLLGVCILDSGPLL